MAFIVPEKGQTRAVARRLLDLADDPHVVTTTAEGPDGVSFVVPDDLYDKYMNSGTEKVSDQTPAAGNGEELPAPKRRGRPPGSKNKPKDAETEE